MENKTNTANLHIKTVTGQNLKQTAEKGGCGKCRASCQSACKTSCTVANQPCEK
jgi:predicted ribosomally synthesized six-cysteine peptide SCIFF